MPDDDDDAEVGNALYRAIVPGSRQAVIDRYGSINSAARVIAGIPESGPLPEQGTAQRRAYASARRNFEGERVRLPLPARLAALFGRRRVMQLRRAGETFARVIGHYIISETAKWAEMPAGGNGQLMSKADTRAWSEPFLRGEYDAAENLFIDRFLVAYDFDDAEIDVVEEIRLWLLSEDEPD